MSKNVLFILLTVDLTCATYPWPLIIRGVFQQIRLLPYDIIPIGCWTIFVENTVNP